VLGVGIDFAEEFHLVALGRPGEGVIEVRRVEHSPEDLRRLFDKVSQLEPDPAEVRVVLETRHGMLVEALVDAGYTVVPVNPDLVARRRGPAKKKDDAEDASIACLIALDRFERLRPFIAHGEIAGELRAIARDDERAARDERRLLNRLRADLVATFPAALEIAGADLGAPTFLRLLEAWPTAVALRAVPREEELVVSNRLACNRYLRDAVQQWAFCSLSQSGWAREFYEAQRARGKGHHAALRALGNRWLEVLWHCVRNGVAYDEETHVANRRRYLEVAAA
jgi:hypothetical protein